MYCTVGVLNDGNSYPKQTLNGKSFSMIAIMNYDNLNFKLAISLTKKIRKVFDKKNTFIIIA